MSNEKLRKDLEKKYNINLNIFDKDGEKTYWQFREYFTKEIGLDNLLINTDCVTLCCNRTDIKSIKKEFDEKMKELTQFENNEVCEDSYCEEIIGERCQYALSPNNSENNLGNINLFELNQENPPPYN